MPPYQGPMMPYHLREGNLLVHAEVEIPKPGGIWGVVDEPFLVVARVLQGAALRVP